jgi:SAM-dependent methyltransferase
MTKPFLHVARETIVPTLRNSNWTYREVLDDVATCERWLDLGCGHQLLPDWMPDGRQAAAAIAARTRLLVGIDADRVAIARHETLSRRAAGDIGRLPFRDGSFDLVTANMVVEHVDDPAALLAEVRRVLRPGGRFLLHTPNRNFYQIWLSLWIPGPLRRQAASFLESRPLDDVYPTHYRLNTAGTIAALAGRAGFDVERTIALNSGLAMKRFPPLAVAELLVIRLLQSPALAWARSNLIVLLRVPPGAAPPQHAPRR